MKDQHGDHTRFMTRKQVPVYVAKTFGILLSHLTLDTLASQGGGPKYVKFGRRAYYEPVDVDAWVKGRTTRKFSSTSDETAGRIE
jgi:hypothetical protein